MIDLNFILLILDLLSSLVTIGIYFTTKWAPNLLFTLLAHVLKLLQKRSKPIFTGLLQLYNKVVKVEGIYPRLPPLPPRFDSVLRFSVDKLSSLSFKKRAIFCSKFSFGWKLLLERLSLFLAWRGGRCE